ncbi:unnamed protein product [Adineta steineri]|uniref:Uncharacterized protein n=1 Tax=Adineta steineri TaxID=433720 RepID=A0A815GHE5_9BILA|nr:unnamed protein product [Adineta steineri]CAF1339967.1 unnamed protein product [Adineta steineri]
MVIVDKILFVSILSFFGYVVVNLPSGFAAPLECNNDYTKEELDDYCKNHGGEKPDICKEYCQKARTIDTSYLPPPLDKLNQTLIGQLRVLCDGFCYENSTCFCTIGSGELDKKLLSIKIGQTSPEYTFVTTPVVIGGKNITLAALICEDPK